MNQSLSEKRFQAKTTIYAVACVILLALGMLAASVYQQDWGLFSFGTSLIIFAFAGMITLTNI